LVSFDFLIPGGDVSDFTSVVKSVTGLAAKLFPEPNMQMAIMITNFALDLAATFLDEKFVIYSLLMSTELYTKA
jgi:hypothetical protein